MKHGTKRLTALVCSLALLLALSGPALAEQPAAVQRDGVTLDGLSPLLLDRRSYLSADRLALALDAAWSVPGVLIRNGRTADLSALSRTVDGAEFFPIRAAAEALGYSVGWDRAARAVLLADITAIAQRAYGDGRHGLLSAVRDDHALPECSGADLTLDSPLLRLAAPDAAALAAELRPEVSGPLEALLSALPLDDAQTSYTRLLAATEAVGDAGFQSGAVRFSLDGCTGSLFLTDGGYRLDLTVLADADRYASPAALEHLGLSSSPAILALSVDARTAACSAALSLALPGAGALSAAWG